MMVIIIKKNPKCVSDIDIKYQFPHDTHSYRTFLRVHPHVSVVSSQPNQLKTREKNVDLVVQFPVRISPCVCVKCMILKHAQHAEKVPKRASYHTRCCSFLVGGFIFILNTRDKKKQRNYLCNFLFFLFCHLRHHKLQLLSAVFIISGFCLVHTKSIFTHASIGNPEHTHSHTLSLSHTHTPPFLNPATQSPPHI